MNCIWKGDYGRNSLIQQAERKVMTAERILLVICIIIGLVSGAEKSPGNDGKSDEKSRTGDSPDQIAEDSRLSEVVEAQEKSYATNSNAGPPPIPVPIPVRVQPGALMLPSPGSKDRGGSSGNGPSNYNPSQGPSSYSKIEHNAQASQPHPMMHSNQRIQGPPPPPGYLLQQFHFKQQQGPPQALQGPPPGMPQGILQGIPQGPPQGIPQGPPQGIPQGPPQGILQGPPQGILQAPPQRMPQGPPQGPVVYVGPGLPPLHQFGGPKQSQGKIHSQGPPPQFQLPPPGYQMTNANIQGPQAPPPSADRLQGRPFAPQHSPPAPQPVDPPPHHQAESGLNPVATVANVGSGKSDSGASGGFSGALGSGEDWGQPALEMPLIVNLEAKCEKNLMKVAIKFDRPFFGVIFSKGHYDKGPCVYMAPGQGRDGANFDIAINGCGTTGNTQNGLYGYGTQTGSGTFFENTIIIQFDPQVQEVWDQARKLRCTWHDYYEKSVTFKPFNVDNLDIVHADFAGDNVGCWMQIQTGKGPWAQEVSGIVKIGQTMTMVLAIKDDENKFDMLVRDCVAHDRKRAPIQLVDSHGCIVRPKLMSTFSKVKNFGSSASVLSYAYFQAFKFPDSMDVHFQCTIQICRFQCPEQCAKALEGPNREGSGVGVDAMLSASETISALPPSPALTVPSLHLQGASGRPRLERARTTVLNGPRKVDRSRRGAEEKMAGKKGIGVNGAIKVVSTGDFAFNLESNTSATVVYPVNVEDSAGLVCISTPSFAVTVIFLLATLIIACIVSAFLCLRHRAFEKTGTLKPYPKPFPFFGKGKM